MGYLDISVLPVRFAHLCIQCAIPLARWVSPFGYLRINASCQLPGAFRRLPRPSSPLTAKASTVCAYSLDHITPNRFGATVQHFAYLPQRHVWFDRTKTLVTSQVFKEHATDLNVRTSSIRKCAQCHPRVICFRAFCARKAGGADRDRTGDPLLAKQVLSQLSYSPIAKTLCPALRTFRSKALFVRIPHRDVRS